MLRLGRTATRSLRGNRAPAVALAAAPSSSNPLQQQEEQQVQLQQLRRLHSRHSSSSSSSSSSASSSSSSSIYTNRMVNPTSALLTGLVFSSRFYSTAASTAAKAGTTASSSKGAGGRAPAVSSAMPRGLSTQAGKLTVENINPSVVAAEYAVRGKVLDRAMALQVSRVQSKVSRASSQE